MKFFNRASMVALAAGAVTLAGPALADSHTGTMTVQAEVQNECSVNSPTLDFGILDISGDNDESADILVTCTQGASYDINLDDGENEGETGDRRMTDDGTNHIVYTLYDDAARTNAIDLSGTGGNFVSEATGTGDEQTHTVYGRVDGTQINQNGVPAGNYSDSVAITVDLTGT